MKTDELRRMIEQNGYVVEEKEVNDEAGDDKFWGVTITKGDRVWGANGLSGQPVANAYRRLSNFLSEVPIVNTDGHQVTPDEIEYTNPND